jgi:hypothetical protein
LKKIDHNLGKLITRDTYFLNIIETLRRAIGSGKKIILRELQFKYLFCQNKMIFLSIYSCTKVKIITFNSYNNVLRLTAKTILV